MADSRREPSVARRRFGDRGLVAHGRSAAQTGESLRAQLGRKPEHVLVPELIDHDENHQPALRRRRGRRQKERGNHSRMTGPGLIDCRRACIVRACSRLGC